MDCHEQATRPDQIRLVDHHLVDGLDRIHLEHRIRKDHRATEEGLRPGVAFAETAFQVFADRVAVEAGLVEGGFALLDPNPALPTLPPASLPA